MQDGESFDPPQNGRFTARYLKTEEKVPLLIRPHAYVRNDMCAGYGS